MTRSLRRLWRVVRAKTKRMVVRVTEGSIEPLDPGIVTALDGFKG